MAIDKKPKPGSPEAVAQGCRCPVLDNAHGAGRFGIGEVAGWYVNENCDLHARGDWEPDDDLLARVAERRGA